MDDTEQLARMALADARRDAKPIEPDRWDRSDGEVVGWASARLVEQVADELLERHGLDVIFDGATIQGNNYQTSWRWSWGSWTSSPTRVDVPLEVERGRGAAAASAAVTTARKIYVRQLLRLKLAEDTEAEIGRAMDHARGAVFDAVAQALDAWCRRHKVAKDRAIRDFTGIVLPGDVEATVAMLHPYAIAMLWQRLLVQSPVASLKHDPGASPKMDDDLPEEMGGAANG